MPTHTKEVLDSKRVCSGCGGKLEGLKTVDNLHNLTIWAGCTHCSRFDNGVPENIFIIAKKLFESGERYYNHMNESEFKTDQEKEYYFNSQMSGLTRLVQHVLSIEAETLSV